MTESTAPPAFIAAPRMSPAKIPAPFTHIAKRFDPGLAEDAAGRYRPESLPLGPKEAQQALQSLLEWGGQFELGQLTTYAAALEDASASRYGSRDEMRELKRFVQAFGAEEAGQQQEASSKAALQYALEAQLTLLLAWAAEERQAEILDAARQLEALQERFDEALHVELDEELAGALGSVAHGGDASPEVDEEGETPWELLVEKMACFLPPATAFVVLAADAHAQLEERGFAPERCQGVDLPAGVAQAAVCARGPLWRLLGRPEPAAEAPPHLREERVLVLAQP